MSAPDVILVGCTKAKRAERAAARDLYDRSDLFVKRRAYAEYSGVPWAVLSALHGVVAPDRVIGPYDFTIQQRAGREYDPLGWAVHALQACFRMVGRVAELGADGIRHYVDPISIELHAGVDYARLLERGSAAFWTSVTITVPTGGLGIGEQKHWYLNQPPDLWRDETVPAGAS